MKRQICLRDIASLCVGASVLGSGGGGDTAILSSFVDEIMKEAGSVDLISVGDLGENDLVIPLAYLGSPAVSLVQGPTLPLFVSLIEAIIADQPNKRIVLMPAEIGGCNALAPLVPASVLGLPVLDADLIGRAFPKVSMCKPAINHPNQTRYFYMSNRDGHVQKLMAQNVAEMEEKAREFCIQSGGSASIATFIFEGDQHSSHAIEGSVTRAFRMGEALLSNQGVATMGGHLQASGMVVSLQRETVGGFLLGSVTLSTNEGEVVVAFQNEYVCAVRGGVPFIQTPDLVVLFDRDTKTPVASETLREGLYLELVSFPSPAFWKEPHATKAVVLDQFQLPASLSDLVS